ncbi:MAG: Hsp20/alpha crystallin family protein [Lentisphaerae bacterium]|nr:Hsp20/alpha crystallin family protein [Lentisphaerota bacterium]
MNKIDKKENQEVKKAGAEVSPVVTDAAFVPYADVDEVADGVRVRVDLPGVADDAAEVVVENGVLRIEARAACEAPAGHDLAGQEFWVGRYHREFALGEGIDTDGVKAKLKTGVLEILLPKRTAARARKVAITN